MRSPSQPVRALRDEVQQAVSCVSDTVVLVSRGGYAPAAANAPHHSLTLSDYTTRLAGPGRLSLGVEIQYRINPTRGERGRWQAEVAAYYYGLYDVDAREILAYHWHPHVENVPFAHLHVSHGAVQRTVLDRLQLSAAHNALRPDLAAAHLPTGQIALQTVLRLAIEQFQVLPRPAHRADWREILGH